MSNPETIEVAFGGRLGAFALDAAFTVPALGVTGVFGPSGCGKTSVLRCIAGLQRLEGRCRVGGEVWQDDGRFVPPHRRAVGYVFQEASLFPHLSVTGNLLFGTRGRQPAEPRDRIGFEEVVTLLGLAPLLERSTHALSGGERQRVAVGRALLSQPRLLLMDEPLSALDRETRNEVLPFLERLHDGLSLPVIYVSHDMSEIEKLADQLVMMRAGRVIASGPLRALQADVRLPLAAAREAAVTLDAEVTGYDAQYGLATLAVAGGLVLVPMPQTAAGTRRRVVVASGQVSVALERPQATSLLNVLPARIQALGPATGGEVTIALALGPDGTGATILARVTRLSADRLALAEGQPVFAQIKGVALV